MANDDPIIEVRNLRYIIGRPLRDDLHFVVLEKVVEPKENAPGTHRGQLAFDSSAGAANSRKFRNPAALSRKSRRS